MGSLTLDTPKYCKQDQKYRLDTPQGVTLAIPSHPYPLSCCLSHPISFPISHPIPCLSGGFLPRR